MSTELSPSAEESRSTLRKKTFCPLGMTPLVTEVEATFASPHP